MFSISTAPAKQSVGETITVLSGRLSSATLLEDRRAAILGLRSFAKDFPASVASGALRSLIGSLSKDAEDVDTVKVVLETLLMLFSPNEDSPEASEEIALWLADEFTMRQENITLLLDFLDTSDFYSRLYSLQLLAAILSARTERTEECVFTAPLGISRLVAVLDDSREAVRNEAITLLTYLTPSSTDIQKLVAFENAFDRLFNIIISEGSLSEGDRVVEDCLILVANLLRRNPSNQSLFRESGGIRRLAVLLEGAGKAQREEAEIAAWAQTQRNRNVYALLAVHGLLYHVLQLAFSRVAQLPIKAEALETCADIIKGNASLQEGFAQLQVPSPLDSHTPVEDSQANSALQVYVMVYVIDGLLDLALGVEDTEAFDLRLAASDCLKAYFYSHADIRLHFLRRAIEGHKTGADETANVLTVLLRPSSNADITNPYRSWFAATIMFHLVFDNPEAKSLAMAVTEGDAESGEEVVTSIQIVAAHLISGLNREGDSRVVVGYLMLLLGWLFEDLDAVNDFLGEGSNTQSIIQAINHPYPSGEIVQGLCAMLLGVLYEFSTKDSPIPRTDFHSILVSRMGRERYIDKLSKLRSNPLVRDFEVIPQKLSNSGSGKLPDVYFDATFVEFFKDNYSRILRGIDRDPGLEISVVSNGVQKGVSRELVDSLRNQLAEKDQALQEAQMAEIQIKTDRRIAALDQERKAIDQRQKEEMDRMQKEVKAQVAAQSEEHHKQLEHARKTAENDAERVRHRAEADMADLKATISRLEVDLMKAKKTKTQEMQVLRDDSTRKLQEQEGLIKKAESRGKQLESELRETREKAIQREAAVRKAEEDKQATQNELDDLLMVFGDLEDKVAKYKAQLKALGEAVSDGEEEEEDSDEDGEEDDEDDAKSEDANGTKT
ncbi:Intracellular protein transport protein USO1 [Colletotrichum sp. SAR11_59]|nr:Intracellular protein transport protein USO1 [Colletotrichum sp. SAR11_59]